jgi:hypothetical protein
MMAVVSAIRAEIEPVLRGYWSPSKRLAHAQGYNVDARFQARSFPQGG